MKEYFVGIGCLILGTIAIALSSLEQYAAMIIVCILTTAAVIVICNIIMNKENKTSQAVINFIFGILSGGLVLIIIGSISLSLYTKMIIPIILLIIILLYVSKVLPILINKSYKYKVDNGKVICTTFGQVHCDYNIKDISNLTIPNGKVLYGQYGPTLIMHGHPIEFSSVCFIVKSICNYDNTKVNAEIDILDTEVGRYINSRDDLVFSIKVKTNDDGGLEFDTIEIREIEVLDAVTV